MSAIEHLLRADGFRPLSLRPRPEWAAVVHAGVGMFDLASGLGDLTPAPSGGFVTGGAGVGARFSGTGAATSRIVPGISTGITAVMIVEPRSTTVNNNFLFGEAAVSTGAYNYGFYSTGGNYPAFFVHNGTTGVASIFTFFEWKAVARPQVWVATYGDGDNNIRLFVDGVETAVAQTGNIQRNTGAHLGFKRWNTAAGDDVLYLGAVSPRRMSPAEVRERMWSVESTYEAVFGTLLVEVPESAGGSGSTITATTSLSAAVQLARSLTAGLSAGIQTTPSAGASVQAAVQASRSAQAQLDAAVQRAQAATASLGAAVQFAGSHSASLAAAVQLARSATAALGLAVQAQGAHTASLSAQVQADHQAAVALSAQVQAGSTVSVAIAAAVLHQALATAGVDLAVQAQGAQTAALTAALQVARNAAAAVQAAVQIGRSAGAAINAQVQGGSMQSAALDAALLSLASAGAAVQVAVATAGQASLGLGAAVALQRSVAAALDAAVLHRRQLGAGLSAYIADLAAVLLQAGRRRVRMPDLALMQRTVAMPDANTIRRHVAMYPA